MAATKSTAARKDDTDAVTKVDAIRRFVSGHDGVSGGVRGRRASDWEKAFGALTFLRFAGKILANDERGGFP